MYAVNGRVLEVDLGSGRLGDSPVPEGLWRDYLGGSGLGSYLLYGAADPALPPLAAESPIFVIAGLLTGTPALTSCKVSLCFRSPLTGIWGESTVGGFWGAQLKAAGYDGIVLRGRAAEPVYLWIRDGAAEIRPAKDLWGKQTYETSDAVRERTDPKAQVACIGPAGENLVEIASVMFGGHDCRAAGRCGVGAVWGSKNLKAIAVRGTGRPAVARPGALAESQKGVLGSIREFARALGEFGTAGGIPGVEVSGDLPIKNWTMGSWTEGAAKISGQAQAKTILLDHYACWACPIHCGKIVRLDAGPYAGATAHGPEYETCAGFGSMLLVDDVNYVAAANDLCNRLGLDTISTSSVIAMAMEVRERGICIPSDGGSGGGSGGGLAGGPAGEGREPDLRWGNGEAMLEAIYLIASRQGIGEALCHGSRALARRLGGLAAEYAVECKGLEVAYHDPRAFTGMAGNYATANRGGCHLEALSYFVESGGVPGSVVGFTGQVEPHSAENKGWLAAHMQDLMEVFNGLGLCKFLLRGRVSVENITDWCNAVTGWDLSVDDLLRLGEKIHNLKRMYNVRLGISRKDDTLPPRLLVHDRKTGRAAGSLPHLGRILSDYYRHRGWNEEGIPTKETLDRLGLGWLQESDVVWRE